MSKVIVSQIGSRRRYMIPQIFEANGMLEHLYTDSYCDSWVGKIFQILKRLGITNNEINRLLRRDPAIPNEKIYANDFLQLKLLIHKIIKSPTIKFKNLRFEGSSRWFKKQGIGKADVLYNMFIENFEFAEYAKSKGVKIICDIYENPYIFKELAEDINTIPEYECIRDQAEGCLESYNLRMQYLPRMLSVSDAYLIPSAYVAESIQINPSFNPEKVHIIPYASSIKNTQKTNNPQKGRIIWIGSDPVRKGLVYCERAARILKEKYPFIDFRIIGSVDSRISRSNCFSSLNFIGRLNKEQLVEEFNAADMFVFPTIAEGFSGALLEAASYGVPVITTHASGFDNDFPGIFITPRCTDEIVNSVEMLLNNREERNRISSALFMYSQSIDKNTFAQGLIQLIKKL